MEQQKELLKIKERQALKKIRNIRQTGELKNKGEEHGRTVVNILIPLKSLSIFVLGTNVENYFHLNYNIFQKRK